jgi:hypothetical protein
MGSGKTTFANEIRKRLQSIGDDDVRVTSFATPLKMLCSLVYKVPLIDFYKPRKDTIVPFARTIPGQSFYRIPRISPNDFEVIGAVSFYFVIENVIDELNRRIMMQCSENGKEFYDKIESDEEFELVLLNFTKKHKEELKNI